MATKGPIASSSRAIYRTLRGYLSTYRWRVHQDSLASGLHTKNPLPLPARPWAKQALETLLREGITTLPIDELQDGRALLGRLEAEYGECLARSSGKALGGA